MLESARFDAGALDEGLHISSLQPDDAAELVGGQLPFVDFAIAFSGQRELSSLAAAVANDAATAALSDERFYRGSGMPDPEGRAGDSDIAIDPVAARQLAQEAVDRRAPRGISNISVVTRTAGRQVCVRLRGEVRYVFARALPGAAKGTRVEGSAVATAVEGDAGSAVDSSSTC